MSYISVGASFCGRLQWQSTSRVASTCDSQVEGAASGAAGPAGKRDAAAPQIEEAVEKAVRVATAPRVVPAGDSAHLRHPAGLALLALAGAPASLPPRQPAAGTVAAAIHAGNRAESLENSDFQGPGKCVPCFWRLLICQCHTASPARLHMVVAPSGLDKFGSVDSDLTSVTPNLDPQGVEHHWSSITSHAAVSGVATLTNLYLNQCWHAFAFAGQDAVTHEHVSQALRPTSKRFAPLEQADHANTVHVPAIMQQVNCSSVGSFQALA